MSLLIDQLAEAKQLLKELADDMEAELNGRYAGTLDYPSQLRRYERDMENIKKARAFIGRT